MYAKQYSLKIEEKKANFKTTQITSIDDVENFARNFYKDDINIFESFFIMLLNHNNNVTGYAKISQGGVSGTVVDEKLIAKYAVDTLSSSVIMVHNHPSGNLRPSNADIDITKKVKNALSLFKIDLLDHVILTETACNSIINRI